MVGLAESTPRTYVLTGIRLNDGFKCTGDFYCDLPMQKSVFYSVKPVNL